MNVRRGLTRREAIGAAGAIGAAHTAGPLVERLQGANDRVGVALIGAGRRGQMHLRRLSRLPAARCVTVADPDETNRRQAMERFAGRLAGTADYRGALSRKDVDAVVVATPPYAHFRIVQDALRAGKHVFCETTVAFRLEEIAALRRLAGERPNLAVQAGYQRRYSQFYQVARAMAAKGFLGQVTGIHAQWHANPGWTMQPGESREKNWRFHREFSHGLTGGVTAHQIDAAGWFFGEDPEYVTGSGGLDWRKDGRDVYDSATLIYRYAGGQQFLCTALTTSRHLSMFNNTREESGEMILGTDGAIEVTLGTADAPSLAMWYIEPGPQAGNPDSDSGQPVFASASIPKTGRVVWPMLLPRDEIRREDSFLQREAKYLRRWLYSKGILLPEEDRHADEVQLEGFLRCCRGEERPRADLEAGLANAAAVILGNLALDEGRRVRFDEIETLTKAGGKGGPR